MKFKLAIYVAGIFLVSIVCAQSDCRPVQKLKELYTTDKEFKQTINAMFKNLQDPPSGVNPWRSKNVNDLYAFLNEWFYFLPNTENGLDRIIEFSMLYYKNPSGMKFVLEEPGLSWTLQFVEDRGKYMDSPFSTKVVNQWLENESIGNEDFVLPTNGFASFNDFFTRDIKKGARPIDGVNDNSVLVSPADGVINMINNDLRLDSEIPTKGRMTLSLNALLGDSPLTEKFIGGTALAVFLLPTNYHHYHVPVSGIVVESNESVGDRLFGMPDIPDMINKGNVAYNKDYSVFENFRHGYAIIETEEYGHVGMVPIGLQTIGSVVFEEKFKRIRKGEEVQVYKGEKLGHFAYGGSTVLLIFEKGRFKAINVKQGQQIGNLNGG